MTTYRATSTNYLTQGFAENLACISLKADGSPTGSLLPAKYPGACPAGSVKLYPTLGLKGHNGEDWALFFREPVHHDTDFVGWMKTEKDDSGGIGVDVVSNEPLVGCFEGCPPGTKHYVKRRYWHLYRAVGFDGKPVKMGDQIGEGDSTGLSSGNHLHRAFKWCDKDGNGMHTDNGFYGAFNDRTVLEWGHQDAKFVVDHLNEKKREDIIAAESYRDWQEAERLKGEILKRQYDLVQLLAKLVSVIQIQIERFIKGRA